MEVKDSDIENQQNITQEERTNIAQEMEQILASRQKVASSEKLNTPVNKNLFSFPLYVNITIFSLLILSVGGVYAYFAIQDKQFLNIQEETNFSENVLARLLIDEAQQAIKDQKSKIQSINSKLSEEEGRKLLLEQQFDEEVEKFVEEIKEKFDLETEKYRRKLEEQNISEAEIERRIEEYARKLRAKQAQELARYKEKQQQRRKEELGLFNARVTALKQQIEDRKLQLQSLEQNINSEKAVLEKQLQQQRSRYSQERAQAEEQIAKLKKSNELRNLAVEKIGIMYKVVLNSLKNGKYDDVKSGIEDFNTAIEQSAYKNDEELLSMKNSLISISRALDTIKLLEKQVSQQSQALEDTSYTQRSKELDEELVRSKEEIELLKKELASSNENSQLTQDEVDANEKKLKTLNKRYKSLESQYTALKTNVNKNMQVIINYLMLKKQKVDEQSLASLRTLIDDFVRQDRYYEILGVLLAQALDPSGELQF